MDTKQDVLPNTEMYKLMPADINHLFGHSGLKGNSLSTFGYDGEQAATSSPSELFKALSESPKFRQIAKKLLEPDLKIEFNRGGAGAADEIYYILQSTDDKAVLGLFVSTDENLVLLLFDAWESFLQWWSELYVSSAMSTYQTVFPNIMETEVLICALNCIDIYRRSYMESMLDYRSGVNLSLTTQNFIDLLKRATASRDKRWLLPTMIEITPGLKNSTIALKPEHIRQIEDLGFVTSDEAVLTLAERSRIMGTEFISSWMGSIGWQATSLINGEEQSLSRVFLAPTAFANHLFTFEIAANGESHFRHQASTRPQIIQALTKWMEALQKVPDFSPPPPVAANSTLQFRFCGNCGTKISTGQKFCPNCGTAL